MHGGAGFDEYVDCGWAAGSSYWLGRIACGMGRQSARTSVSPTVSYRLSNSYGQLSTAMDCSMRCSAVAPNCSNYQECCFSESSMLLPAILRKVPLRVLRVAAPVTKLVWGVHSGSCVSISLPSRSPMPLRAAPLWFTLGRVQRGGVASTTERRSTAGTSACRPPSHLHGAQGVGSHVSSFSRCTTQE